MERAQKWADHLAATNAFEHSKGKLNGGCVGENIFSSSGGKSSAIDATRAWYCEVDDYYSTINKWQNSPMIGHFTQVSEKSTHHGYLRNALVTFIEALKQEL